MIGMEESAGRSGTILSKPAGTIAPVQPLPEKQSHVSPAPNMSKPEDSTAAPIGTTPRDETADPAWGQPRVMRRRSVQLPLRDATGGNGEIRTLTVTELFTDGRGPLLEGDLFAERAELTIGLNAASITGMHTYLMVGEIRIDGRLVYLPERRAESRVVNDGILVRCVGLPEWHREILLAWVRSKESVKAATCVAVASKILYQIGNLGLAPRRDCWFPAAFFSHLAHHGLRSRDGNPVELGFYSINRDADRAWCDLAPSRLLPGLLRRTVALARKPKR